MPGRKKRIMNEHVPGNSTPKSNKGLKTVLNKQYKFRQLDPLPAEEEIEEIYRKQFASTTRPEFLAKKEQDRLFWQKVHSRKMKIVDRLLGTKDNKNGKKKIMDIGCGTGQILEDFREWGWDIFGVEPSEAFKSLLHKKNIPFSDGMFGSIPEKDMKKWGQFDFINMTNLLEHVLDPVGLTKTAVNLLKEGGILCIDSPNDFNPLQITAQKQANHKAWWINPLHLNYFNKPSLENIMRDLGMTPVYSGAQFPMELFLLFGNDYINNSEIGKQCHKMRVSFEDALHRNQLEDLLIDLYGRLAELGIGRTIAVYGRKER